jgi:RNA polymerase sigma-70 factor, ECF subfamily
VAANAGDVTLLLREWKSGNKSAESKLFELLMPELRRIARRYFQRERRNHTLQPTALVNEAFLKLAATKNIDWQDRGHFLALAARVMRRYLIDHWRARQNFNFVGMENLPERVLAQYPQAFELATALDSLLEEMESVSHEWRAVVELKFFLGLTDEAAADALSLPLRTLQRDWHRARKWLFQRLMPCR